jgi:zeaxanthin glucosyltransferase
MTRIALLCPAASGHLNPMTTLGQALQQRGHRVSLVGLADARPTAEAAGLGFVPLGAAEFPQGATREIFARLGERSGLAVFRATLELFRQTTAMVLREAPPALRALGAEALLIDQASFGGATVAEAVGVPFVSVSCALLLNQEPDVPPINTGWRYRPTALGRLRNRLGHRLVGRLTRPIEAVVGDYRRQTGLPPRTDARRAYSQLAQICQQPAEFEYPRRGLPPWFHFTGPLVDPASRAAVPFPWERLTGQPLIYASLGTIQNRQLALFATIAAACRHLDAQLVIALGGGSRPEDLPPLPGAPLVVAMAPQLELLPRAALTITHAGMNTVLESLSHGVPMVAIPIANDQPGVAARIAWTGTGAVVPLRRLSEPRLRRAIDQVWNDPACRANAQRLQQAIARAGGVGRAADIVEQVIRSGRPVM